MAAICLGISTFTLANASFCLVTVPIDPCGCAVACTVVWYGLHNISIHSICNVLLLHYPKPNTSSMCGHGIAQFEVSFAILIVVFIY